MPFGSRSMEGLTGSVGGNQLLVLDPKKVVVVRRVNYVWTGPVPGKSCANCKHIHEHTLFTTCDAFPAGIPTAFINNDEFHGKPFPGGRRHSVRGGSPALDRRTDRRTPSRLNGRRYPRTRRPLNRQITRPVAVFCRVRG